MKWTCMCGAINPSSTTECNYCNEGGTKAFLGFYDKDTPPGIIAQNDEDCDYGWLTPKGLVKMPEFNISDVFIIKTALTIVKPSLTPELKKRADYILKKTNEALKEYRND